MRTKIIFACLLLWSLLSCNQGTISPWANPDTDAGQQASDLHTDSGADNADQAADFDDAGVLADGDPSIDQTFSDSPADNGSEYDAGSDEDNHTCLSGEQPSLGGLSPEELHSALENKDFLLINVASASGGQIPGTDTYIPYNDTDALVEYIGDDLQTKVVLYCVSSGRSSVAGKNLVERGYCSIRHLLGGMNAWTAAGFSLE